MPIKDGFQAGEDIVRFYNGIGEKLSTILTLRESQNFEWFEDFEKIYEAYEAATEEKEQQEEEED